MSELQTKCGYVAIIGRPNVGKSTLLNYFLGKKLSITSRKPQTTRYSLLGIKTEKDTQIIYVDTPGLHTQEKGMASRQMNRAARSAIHDVQVVVFVVSGTQWQEQDESVLQQLKNIDKKVILAVNKIDLIKNREELLPHLQQLGEKFNFHAIVPISVKKGESLALLQQEIIACLPIQPFLFPVEQATDRGEQFIAAEIIREKLMRQLGQELPYVVLVTIDEFVKKGKVRHISATIWTNKESQKPIVIGKKGERLKVIGTKARIDLEAYLDEKVFLQLWVKVKGISLDIDKGRV